MGKINQGILGGVSGKVGSVVGASWKGVPTVRVYQPTVSNPKTTDQTTQRAGFAQIVAIASILLATVVKNFWDRFAVKMSGFNSFIQAQKTALGGFVSSISDVVFCTGKMGATNFTKVAYDSTAVEPRMVSAIWPTTLTDRYALTSDIACVVVYSNKDNDWRVAAVYSTDVKRSTGQADFDPTDLGFDAVTYPMNTLRFRLFFRRADGSIASVQSAEASATDEA